MRNWLSNLRVRLLFLVIVAVLPAVGLLILSASEQRNQAITAAQDDAQRLANLAAADQSRLIESTRQLLVVLARLPELRAQNGACDRLLVDLRAQFPIYANLGVIAPDGTLACSAVQPSSPVNLSDRAYFRAAVATRDFAVGDYQIGRVTGKPALNCAYPILDAAGAVLGVVYAALDLATVAQFGANGQLPADAVVTVFDRGGTVLIRQPNTDNVIGRSLAGTPVVDEILTKHAGVTEGTENGQIYLYAFASLGAAGSTTAYLSLAIPEARVAAPADDAFSRNLTRLGLVVLVVLASAWVGGDLLGRQSSDANKAIVRRVYDAFGSGGVDLLDELVAADFRDRDPMPGQAPGLAGLKQAVGLFRAAFPDGEVVVDELVAEGDQVVARVTLRGTQTGEFFGAAPSGRLVRAEGVESFRIAKGKIVEGRSRFSRPMIEADHPSAE